VSKLVPEAVVHADDIAWRPWADERSAPFLASGRSGDAWVKILSRDPASGSESLIYKLDKGWSASTIENTVYENLLVLDGVLQIDGQELFKGFYSYRPEGHVSHDVSSPTGATVIAYAGAPGEQASKNPLPALDSDSMPWTHRPIGTEGPRYFVKMLRGDEENLDTFYLMRAVRGSQTHSVAHHDAPEEGFFLEGLTEFYDGSTGGILLGRKGTYVHRGPGSPHGHVHVLEDQVLFKHDYFTNEVAEALEIFLAAYPVETDAVRALREGRDPGLATRW
jgi:hypothetical protein